MTEKQVGIWLAALKSGKYQQLQNELVDVHKNKHCCIGVLADVFNVRCNDALEYPDDPSVTLAVRLSTYNIDKLIALNDRGPIDNYKRVICELESAPELYITER